MKKLIFFIAFLFWVCPALATERVVSTNAQFNTALASTVAGDIITLANGTYSAISIDCTSGPNGTSISPITIRAQNERQAYIHGTGNGVDPFVMQNCHWYVIQGLHVDNSDVGFGGEAVMVFKSSTDFVLRRNLVNHPNHNDNVHGIVVSVSERFLIEENEVWEAHRHFIQIRNRTSDGGGTGNHIVRRNYCNPYPLLFSQTGGNCVVMYPSSQNILENNISENNEAYDIESDYGAAPTNNRFLGNISVGAVNVREVCRTSRPTSTTVRNNVTINAGTSESGFSLRGSTGLVFDNNTSWNANIDGMALDQNSDCAAGGSVSMTGQNNLMIGSARYGFNMTTGTWTLDHPNAQGSGTANFSPGSGDSRYTVPTTATPIAAQASCPFFIIPGSTGLKGAGVSGGDIGANIKYATENGVLTTKQFWNATTKQVNSLFIGAVVAGVNDVNGLGNFGSRYQSNCATASFGYGTAPLVLTITTNGGNGAGANFTTTNSTYTLGGTLQ